MDRMMKQAGRLVVIAALLAMTGVMMGAFAAHGLKAILAEGQLQTLKTAVLYQFIHSLAILACSLLVLALSPVRVDTSGFIRAGYAFVVGVFLFSGSLYGLVLLEWRFLGPVTPIGGVAFIIGWAMVAWSAFRLYSTTDKEST